VKSDVFFVKLESSEAKARIEAMKRMISAVGYFFKFEKDEFVPVKLTIGDSPCVYYISPELVKLVTGAIKQQQAKPFLFDTSVIYKGQRQNAVDHLNLAQEKGFGHAQTEVPFIVADGVFGQDGREFQIEGNEIERIKIPSFIGMVDSLVVLSHATGHIVSGYGGAIKNVAMGMSCRPTKQVQHSSLKPSVVARKCISCGCCVAICPVNAISLKNEKTACIDQKVCIGCGECLCACKFDAIYINWHEEPEVFCRRMVDVAKFILSKFKNKFYFNFALDITKECDCISARDEQMISEDIGILASRDILSLDKATVDLALLNKKSPYLDEKRKIYEGMFDYAAGKSLGNLDYNLVKLE